MEDLLTHSTFSQHLNTTFQAEVDDSKQVELQLTEVSNVRRFPHQEQFSIVFLGPVDTYLGQGTRSLKHNEMGQFDLFIVPIAQDQEGVYYQAVFNRIIEDSAQPKAD